MGFGQLGAAQDAQKAQQERQDSQFREAFKHEIFTIDTEVLVGRFIGGANEPFVYDAHGYAKFDGRFDTDVCMAPEPCPACVAASRQTLNAATGKREFEKRVKKASPRAAATFFSMREVLLIPRQKQDGSSYTERVVLRRNAQNQHIQYNKDTGAVTVVNGGVDPRYNQYPKELEGLKIWCGSLHPKAANFDQIMALDVSLQQQCMCGKEVDAGFTKERARVVVQRYTCAMCGAQVQYDNAARTPVVCSSCHHVNSPPEAELICTAGCGNPRRGSLTECYVKVTQQGSNDGKSYKFESYPFSEIHPDHLPFIVKMVDGAVVPNLFDLPALYKRDLSGMKRHLQERGITLGNQQPGGGGGAPPAGGLPPIGGPIGSGGVNIW